MDFVEPPPTAISDEVFDRVELIPSLDHAVFGSGLCRRRVRLRNLGPELTVGELEDDFHHFRVELHHDGETIRAVRAMPLRGPWTTCMEVGEPLREIEGKPLSSRSTTIGTYAAATSNCTHLFDLTGLAIAQATRSTALRQYDMLITDPSAGLRELVIWRDGERVFRWTVGDSGIVSPSDYVDVPMFAKFIPWAEQNLSLDEAEAAIALRRMLHIAVGREINIDDFATPNEHVGGPTGRCYSYTPEVAVRAVRRPDSSRDFVDESDAALLLSDMDLRDRDLLPVTE